MKKRNTTRSQAISLGVANMVVSLCVFVTPMILVRVMGKPDFAEYRLLWLLASTAQLIAPIGLPRGLMYFLPRTAERQEKAQYLTQAILMLCVTGLLAALLASPLNPFLPEKFYLGDGIIVPAFIFLWVVASLVETLPSADQNFGYQAFALISNAVVRLALITGVAYLTNDVQAVFIALLVYALYKTAVLTHYIKKYHAISFLNITWVKLREQLSFAVPFGMMTIINNFRRQVEQWIVAFIFMPEMYAIFSVGALEIPVLRMMRSTLGQVVFPKMSQAHAKGDFNRVLYLNQSANFSTALVAFPLSAFIFFYAEALVTLMFTKEYIGAALVFQVYLILTIARVVDVANVMMIFSQKLFVTKVSVILLVVSSLLSYIGAKTLGIAGAACGSVVAQVIITLITFNRATHLLSVRFRDLQDWQSLGTVMFGSALAAAISYYAGEWLLPGVDLLLKTIVGGFCCLILYFLFLWLLGYGWVLRVFRNKSDWSEEFMRKTLARKDGS